MADKSGYAGLADRARVHRRAARPRARAARFCVPTTNCTDDSSGYEAPVNPVYSQRNRSACIRIPMYSEQRRRRGSSSGLRSRFREPISRVLGDADGGAGGNRARTRPVRQRTTTSSRTRRSTFQVPASLERPSTRSSETTSSCSRGSSKELIETWIAWKRENEIDAVRLRPHPAEFALLLRLLETKPRALGGEREHDDRRQGPTCAVAVISVPRGIVASAARAATSRMPLLPIPSVRLKPTSLPMKSAVPAASSSATHGLERVVGVANGLLQPRGHGDDRQEEPVVPVAERGQREPGGARPAR